MAPNGSTNEDFTSKTGQTPPMENPRVKIGKQFLALKWDFMAEYVLSTWGVDTAEAIRLYNSLRVVTPAVMEEDGLTVKVPAVLKGEPGRLAATIDLLSGCLAHNYITLGQEAPRGSHWAQVLSEMPQEDVLKVYVGLGQALGKRTPVKETTPTPPAVQAEPAPQVQ